jgi:hypothetical protein
MSANLVAEEIKVCENIKVPVEASVTIESLFNSIPQDIKNNIFSVYKAPILFSLKINSLETPFQYLEDKAKLEIAENKLSKFYESKHKEINEMKGIFIGKFGKEEEVLSQKVTALIIKTSNHRIKAPIGVELKVGAKCKGWYQFNLFQQDGKWVLFSRIYSMSKMSGSDCYDPTEICTDTYTLKTY